MLTIWLLEMEVLRKADQKEIKQLHIIYVRIGTYIYNTITVINYSANWHRNK